MQNDRGKAKVILVLRYGSSFYAREDTHTLPAAKISIKDL
jgi:hypothetical protein